MSSRTSGISGVGASASATFAMKFMPPQYCKQGVSISSFLNYNNILYTALNSKLFGNQKGSNILKNNMK
jgi:hypothetical protein